MSNCNILKTSFRRKTENIVIKVPFWFTPNDLKDWIQSEQGIFTPADLFGGITIWASKWQA